MSTKKELIEDPNSCWNKAKDDEPLFILRGQDIIAPEVVRHWVYMVTPFAGFTPLAGVKQVYDYRIVLLEKVNKALDCANAMEAWPNRKYPD